MAERERERDIFFFSNMAKREIERDINEDDFFKVYLGDSNQRPQPSRENIECYP